MENFLAKATTYYELLYVGMDLKALSEPIPVVDAKLQLFKTKKHYNNLKDLFFDVVTTIEVEEITLQKKDVPNMFSRFSSGLHRKNLHSPATIVVGKRDTLDLIESEENLRRAAFREEINWPDDTLLFGFAAFDYAITCHNVLLSPIRETDDGNYVLVDPIVTDNFTAVKFNYIEENES